MRSSMICTPHPGNKIEKNEMGGARGEMYAAF
jgi:hypothetical protein